MDVATIAGIVGAVAAVVVVPPAYLALRKGKGSDRAEAENPLPPAKPADKLYDAFISYAPKDSAQAAQLVRQLEARGREIYHAPLIGDGLIEILEKEKALLGSANGILAFSQATMASPAVRADYAALLERANESGGRFVPVLLEPVRLPPFAAIRKPADLTDPASPGYSARVDRLAEAIRPDQGN